MQPKFCLVILMAFAFWYQSAAEGPEREENLPIPRTFKPLFHTLSFDVESPEKANLFEGTAVITAECLVPTNEIILNMKDLVIKENGVTVLKKSPDSKPEPLNLLKPVEVDIKRERLIISLENPVEAKAKVEITIDYKKVSPPRKSLDDAFVRYSYQRKPDAEEKWVAVTKSGAVNARRWFPCLDEPDAKTSIEIKITRKYRIKNDDASTSMDVDKKDENEPNTPELNAEPYPHPAVSYSSTFAAGFVVGQFESNHVKDDSTSSRQIQIWADADVMNQMDFAKDMSWAILNFYLDYFEVYGSAKVDIVALPYYNHVDKWRYGLMTIEESLIINQNPSTEVRENEIALQLCDGLCQQFFGPQVTLSKWNENWINMGLSQFFRIPCFEKIFPKKEASASIVDVHLVESFIRVRANDTEIKSHPVMRPDMRIDLTKLLDDSILAETAYFLVRMMSYFLGKDIFYEHIKYYISEFRHDTLNLNEFWAIFPIGEKNTELLQSHIPVKDIMESWIFKKGYARIKMIREEDKNYVTIQQELPESSSDNTNGHRIIPLNFVTNSELLDKTDQEETVRYWLQSTPIRIPVDEDDWIIFNSGLDVLCHIDYDLITLKSLGETLLDMDDYKMIPVLSRTQLIVDIFASAEMGKLSYSTVLYMMEYLKHEKSPLPMLVALHEFNRMRLVLMRKNVYSSFETYVKEILESVLAGNVELFSNVGEISQNDYGEYYFKKIMVASGLMFDVGSYRGQSFELFKKWRTDYENDHRTEITIPEALRECIFCEAVRAGVNVEWDFLFSLYSNKNPMTLNKAILNALGCSKNSKILLRVLNRSIDSTKIAPEDSLTAFQSLASNIQGYSTMNNFIDTKIDQLLEMYENNPTQMYRYFEILYEITNTQEAFDKLESFTTRKTSIKQKLVDFETRLQESKKIAIKNISWSKKMEDETLTFFDKAENKRSSEQGRNKKPKTLSYFS